MNSFPANYKPKLDLRETEYAIKYVKDDFEASLAELLHLERVSAPPFLEIGTGLQDDLAGTQEPVAFKTKFSDNLVEIVHSLAKWKRYALDKYGYEEGSGLYTDMNAIRKDEDISPIHSIYVDQWDWEKAISKKDRNLDYLAETVNRIYIALQYTNHMIGIEFETLEKDLPANIEFVYSEDLEKLYPKLTPKEREHRLAQQHGAAFLIGIGYPLASGEPHDLRAADYDDWSTRTKTGYHGLNGDIIVWDNIRKTALELSSMGIRVDAKALKRQLRMHNLQDNAELDFHKAVLEERLPLSIGGGIGQSRLCMYLLEKAHIGEVQASVWPKYVQEEFKKQKVPLL